MNREIRCYLQDNCHLIEQISHQITTFRVRCYGERPTKIVMSCETYRKLLNEDRKYCKFAINNATVIDKIFGIDIYKYERLPINQIILIKEESMDRDFNPWLYMEPSNFKKVEKLPKHYIINKGATILFWGDGSKTVVKRGKDDEYNKQLGFLWAYFQKTSGLSKTKANKYLAELLDSDDLDTVVGKLKYNARCKHKNK